MECYCVTNATGAPGLPEGVGQRSRKVSSGLQSVDDFPSARELSPKQYH